MNDKTPTADDVGRAGTHKALNDLEQDARATLETVFKAKAALNNEYFKAVMEGVEATVMQMWRDSAPEAVGDRERCRFVIDTLGIIRAAFEQDTHGELTANKSIENIITKRKWFEDKKVRYAT